MYGPVSVEVIDLLVEIGHAKIKYFGRSRGKKHYNRAMEIIKANGGENSVAEATLLFEIAQRRMINGATRNDIRKAEKQYQTALNIYSEKLGDGHLLTAQTSYRLGELYKLTKKKDKATSYLQAAVTTFDNKIPTNKITQRTHTMLVGLLEDLGKSNEATAHCQAIGRIKAANKEDRDPNGFQPIKLSPPKYPSIAQKKGIQGDAILSLTVTKEGRTTDIKIVNVKGHKSFGRAALRAAKKFRYAARFVDGKSVDTKNVIYKFRFRFGN